jgi:hypothetical protein
MAPSSKAGKHGGSLESEVLTFEQARTESNHATVVLCADPIFVINKISYYSGIQMYEPKRECS